LRAAGGHGGCEGQPGQAPHQKFTRAETWKLRSGW
jgi:hypothetical protein